jgi:hypothetical protein
MKRSKILCIISSSLDRLLPWQQQPRPGVKIINKTQQKWSFKTITMGWE